MLRSMWNSWVVLLLPLVCTVQSIFLYALQCGNVDMCYPAVTWEKEHCKPHSDVMQVKQLHGTRILVHSMCENAALWTFIYNVTGAQCGVYVVSIGGVPPPYLIPLVAGEDVLLQSPTIRNISSHLFTLSDTPADRGVRWWGCDAQSFVLSKTRSPRQYGFSELTPHRHFRIPCSFHCNTGYSTHTNHTEVIIPPRSVFVPKVRIREGTQGWTCASMPPAAEYSWTAANGELYTGNVLPYDVSARQLYTCQAYGWFGTGKAYLYVMEKHTHIGWSICLSYFLLTLKCTLTLCLVPYLLYRWEYLLYRHRWVTTCAAA
ncbi:ORF20 [Ranid herpesvirus 1]|uniref:ORF20 n=1 Tax=Ranid herpesvirus 1 TaxID=85655 RepID=Q14VT8_9VIRU|nr:ORF20 [Ranid herpesvirus 1]ABG25760.1 ORF20 [Ranid herpesvirus 1]